MIARALKVSAVVTIVTALHDPARLAIIALGIHRMREEHPEMFDGKLASENVELAAAEYAKIYAKGS